MILHVDIVETFPLLIGETGGYFVDLQILQPILCSIIFFKRKITLNKTNYKGIGYGRAYTSILPLSYCFTIFFTPISFHVYFVPLAIIL